MKRFARLLLVTVGFGLLGFAMSLVPQKSATGSGSAPVSIVSSVPLTVDVNNFPAIQNVSFNGIAQPVSFDNTDATPLFVQDVENPGRTGFQLSATCTFDQFDQCIPSAPIYTVPAGKVAVLEYASGQCLIDSGTAIAVANVGFAGQGPQGSTGFVLVPGPAISLGGGAEVSLGQQVRAYVFGGSSGNPLLFKVVSNGPESGQSDLCELNLGGHTISQ